MSRKEDATIYVTMHPEGEAKTVRVGYMRIPFWRCRPKKGYGSWLALPFYTGRES